MFTDRVLDTRGMEICVKTQINIYLLGPEVETQCTHDYCLIKHLASEGDFTTSELQAINWCRMSKSIFFIRNISNHQCTHIQQSETDKNTNFNLIHYLNWPIKITQQQQN